MNYSAQNAQLWSPIIQFAIIAGIIVAANFLRRKLPFIRKSLMPTAVIGGFLLLLLRTVCTLPIQDNFLENVTYHGIALGFIALSLRVPSKQEKEQRRGDLTGLKSGAVIVGSYLIQGFFGLLATLLLARTFMPNLFEAAGILLPMGYGQGPGQANNIGGSYEAQGFVGGRSFGLAVAASGFLCACIVGVIYINILSKRGKLKRVDHNEVSGSVSIDTFQDENEIPISESLDKFSIQVALVLGVYGATYLVTLGLESLITAIAPGAAGTVSSLLWGFNFMIGSLLAIGLRGLFTGLRKTKIMTRQYQNNYLLNRISGFAFDVMIVAGIGSIDIEQLSGLWVPFIVLSIIGAVVTFVHLRICSKKVYPDYENEGFVSMYGTMTGTISSGILLLREIDTDLKTPAATNLITGSAFAIVFGAPVLIFVGMAPNSPWLVLGLIAAYYLVMMAIIFLVKKKK